MNCHFTIPVAKILGSSVNSREASTILWDYYKHSDCNHIELDFNDVDFISRSFADQFFFDKNNLETNQNKFVIINNASENILKMLSAVEKNKTSSKTNSEFTIVRYSSPKKLESFLLSF